MKSGRKLAGRNMNPKEQVISQANSTASGPFDFPEGAKLHPCMFPAFSFFWGGGALGKHF